MSKEQVEANRILSEYGRRMYDSHVRYFSGGYTASSNNIYRPARIKSMKRTAKRALILCAILILVMSLALAVCSALGLQIFNYKFDIKDGFIVITDLDDEDGNHFYRPEYIATGYAFKEVVSLGDTTRYYIYENENNELEYSIEEGISKDVVRYIDNEGYDVHKEVYSGYELLVYNDRISPRIIVYMEKNGTYIAMTGQLSMEEIHSIIDSLVVDEST